jgi:thiol-disulfide isomerase/thioredoxin
MNRNIITVIGVVVLVLGGGGLFIASQQRSGSEDAMMKKSEDSMMKDDARYVEYSKTVLDNSSDKRRVLYFYASWCPICRPADADFKQNSSKIPEDVVVIRVNYNDPDTDQEEKDLAKKYGITYQHTFVQIDTQGKEITKWSGGQTDELLTNLK